VPLEVVRERAFLGQPEVASAKARAFLGQPEEASAKVRVFQAQLVLEFAEELGPMSREVGV
jgi:hypothetical protein